MVLSTRAGVQTLTLNLLSSLVFALLFRIVSPACRLSWSSFFALDTYVERPRKAHLYVLGWLPLTPLVLIYFERPSCS